MADPWSQFKPVGVEPSADPWSRFVVPGIAVAETRPALEGTVRPDPKSMAPAELAKYEYGIDVTGDKKEVRAAIGQLPAEQRKPAMDLWAKHFRSEEKKTQTPGQGMLSKVNDIAETIARGTPIGSWGDEIDAGLKQAAYTMTGGGMGAPYDEAVAYNRARQEDFDANNPLLSVGLKLGGAVASLPVTPSLAAGPGASMLSRIGKGALTGMGYGTLYGAGEGTDTGSRVVEGAKGLAIGGGVGAAAVPVAAGIGNATKFVADKYRGIPQPLQGMNRAAVTQTADDMAADRLYMKNGTPLPPGYKSYSQNARELGPEGMIGDMGDNLQGRMAGLANIPGEAKTIVRDALTERAVGSPRRIGKTTDRVIGPEQNLVQVGADITDATRQAAKPFYDQFNSTPIKATDRLISIVQRVPKPAWAKAKELAEAEGIDLREVINMGRGLDYIKRGIDDIVKAAPPGSNEQRIFGNLARDLRTEVDTILNPSNPAKSSWAQARALSGEGKQFMEAVEDGGKVFNRSVHPDQLAADLKGATPIEQAATVYGARGQIRDVMGNATSRNNTAEQNVVAAAKARDLLSSDYARKKLDTVLNLPVASPLTTPKSLPLAYRTLGNGRAGDLIARLDAETRFANTQNVATGNSVTTARQQTIKDMGPINGKQAAAEAGKKGPLGIATEQAWRAANALLGGHLDARRAAKAIDMARMLTAQGADRELIANALIRFGQSRAITTQGKEAITRLAQDVLNSPRFAFIDAAGEKTAK